LKYLLSFSISVCTLILSVGVHADNDLFRAGSSRADIGPVAGGSWSDATWDVWFYTDVTATTGSASILGCQFAEGCWYITDGMDTQNPDDNVVHVLSDDGELITSFPQPATSTWGFRDLTFDGDYLYASGDSIIYAFDLDGNMVPDFNIQGPYSPNRGLAYDPLTDHFWTSTIYGALSELDRNGDILWEGTIPMTGLYGLAWDYFYYPGRLWLYSQSGYPTSTTITGFDPVTHLLTNDIYTIPLLPGLTDQAAGGICITDAWILPGTTVFGCIAQSSPSDQLFMTEIHSGPCVPPIYEVTMEPPQPPIVIPPQGDELDYTISVDNYTGAPETLDVWIDVILPNENTLNLILREVALWPFNPISRDLSLSIPQNAPPGIYLMFAQIGTYPVSSWDFSCFLFFKEEAQGESLYDDDPALILKGGDNWVNSSSARKSQIDGLDVAITPNPFNPTTTISIQLSAFSHVNLSVYDVTNRKIATLIDGYRQAGSHQATFDGSGLASGIYFYRMKAGDFNTSGKMVLLK